MNIFNYLLISLFTILFCYIIFYWIYKSCFGSKIIEGIDGGNSKNTKSKDTKKDEGKEGEEGEEGEDEDEDEEDEEEGDDSETQDEKNKNGTKVVTKSSVRKKDKKKRKGPSSKEIEKQSNEANAKLLDFNKDRQEANQPTPPSDKLLQAKFS
jgi:hypothetical protein